MADLLRIRVKDAFMAEMKAEADLIEAETYGDVGNFSAAVRLLIREGIVARRARRVAGQVLGANPAQNAEPAHG